MQICDKNDFKLTLKIKKIKTINFLLIDQLYNLLNIFIFF